MLEFQDFLALPLTGESFNQCFHKETLMNALPPMAESEKNHIAWVGRRALLSLDKAQPA